MVGKPEQTDTIAAIATAPGQAAVGIVKLSGPDSGNIVKAICGAKPGHREARPTTFLDAQGQVLDRGLALFFQGPDSHTGEDIAELHGHGGPVVMNLLLQRVLSLGARYARPGEFSERAFLNNKIDLLQAEAVADLISSASEQAASSAARSMQGAFPPDWMSWQTGLSSCACSSRRRWTFRRRRLALRNRLNCKTGYRLAGAAWPKFAPAPKPAGCWRKA